VLDLTDLTVKSGNIEAFQNTWNAVLFGVKERPSDSMLESVYYRAVHKFPTIALDVAHYDRVPEGAGGDRCYSFLFDAVTRYIQRARQRVVREDISKSIRGVSSVAAPATEPKAKGAKGKGKGTDKGGTGSASSTAGGDCPKKEVPCRYFNPEGGCIKGDNCGFKHAKGSKRKAETSKDPGKAGAEAGASGPRPCDLFETGDCKFGSVCRYSHEASSTPKPKGEAKAKAKAKPEEKVKAAVARACCAVMTEGTFNVVGNPPSDKAGRGVLVLGQGVEGASSWTKSDRGHGVSVTTVEPLTRRRQSSRGHGTL